MLPFVVKKGKYNMEKEIAQRRIVKGGLSKQDELYETLSCKAGQEVLDLLIEWYGKKLLSDELFNYLQNEGIIEKDEESKNDLMKRYEFDKTIKAKSIKEAGEKFAKALIKKGYDWLAEEITESIDNGYRCMSNATRHNLLIDEVTFPITDDWSYYWAITETENNQWYAWFIEKPSVQ